MKKLIIMLIAAMPLAGFAQSAKVITAWKNLQDYKTSGDPASLQKAKDAIDLATANEDTKQEAKTWLYRGQIYMALYELALKNESEKQADPAKKVALGYQLTPSNDLDVAQEAFRKTLELDKKSAYTKEAKDPLKRSASHYENKGVSLYNSKLYAEAVPAFEKAYEVRTALNPGVTDTTNLVNIAVSAEKGKVYDKAKTYYQKLIEIKHGKGGANYTSLANVYMASGDTTGAMEVIKKGRAAFPGDIDLLITETNHYLKKDQKEAAINNLKTAIEKKPNDANLYLVLANTYDRMANPKDAEGRDAAKPANYEQLITDAEAYYKKAIEISPDNVDALYSLGALYFNHGVGIGRAADSIKDMAKYNAENKRAGEQFTKALPHLEKAHALSPTDRSTMIALKQIYARLNQPDKVKEISDKLNAGKGN
jgi:tetratricopeptide (TPR) repeat protein